MRLPMLGEFKVVTLRECPPVEKLVDTPDKAAAYWREHVIKDPRHNTEVETLVGLVLSTRRHIQGHYFISTGTLNHPSGDPTPSEADIKVTRDLIRAGQLLKIELIDHVIMGRSTPERVLDYVSLRESGFFYT